MQGTINKCVKTELNALMNAMTNEVNNVSEMRFFEFFTIELRLILTFRMVQESSLDLASSSKAVQWSGGQTKGTVSGKTTFSWCARL